MPTRHLQLFCCLLLAMPLVSRAQFTLDREISSHAVLQRDAVTNFHGTAAPNTVVEVRVQGSQLTGVNRTNSEGRWRVQLPPKPAGGPFELLIFTQDTAVLLEDVYFGDVFIASGQSNMEWPLANSDRGASRIATPDPLIRELSVVKHAAEQPTRRLRATSWKVATREQVGDFSAVAYYMAETLRARDPEVAIGIVNATWGGSKIEAWLPTSPDEGRERVEHEAAHRSRWQEIAAAYPEALREGGSSTASATGEPIQVGGFWEERGWPAINGVIYHTLDVKLRDADLRGPATLALGPIDDSDSTYVNGTLVGSMMQQYAKTRRYTVPASALRDGTNRIDIWIEDTGGGGGLYGTADSIYLQTVSRRIPIGAQTWTARPQRLELDTFGAAQHRPRRLYNGMLFPLEGLTARGIVWYQGESNAGSAAEVEAYGAQLRELVEVFRKTTGVRDLPFVTVELPDFLGPSNEPYASSEWWPAIREAQRSVVGLPNASFTSTLGLGDSTDIHPRNKQPVGEALANELRALAYEEPDAPRSPLATKLEQTAGMTTVLFERVGEGLKTRDGAAVRGFALQDTSGRWTSVSAQLIGLDRVKLQVPPDTQVAAVAYAWQNNPIGANLVNSHGLPVGSFRLSVAE